VLPDGVIQHNFLQKWCHFIAYACVHGRKKEIFHFPASVDFSKIFLWCPKVVKFVFLPLEIRKTAFFAEIFKFLPPFRNPYACV